MKQAGLITVIFIGCSLWLFVASVFAQLEVHPRLYLEEEYTDNLFLDDVDEQQDWVSTIEPGINLVYDSRSLDLTLDYSLRYIFYKNNSDRDLTDIRDVQRADGRALLFAERPFTLLLGATASRETIDDRFRNAENNELINRTTVYRYEAAPEYRLQFSSSFSLVFGYSYEKTDYVSSQGDDYQQHTGSFSTVKQLSSQTEVSANYYYRIYDFVKSEDFDQQDLIFRLVQQISSRVNGTVEVGYTDIKYTGGQDDGGYNWLVDLSYDFSEPLTFSIGYSQAFPVSITQGVSKTRSGNLLATYEKNGLVSNAELYWRKLDFQLSTRVDEVFGSRFDLSLPLSNALTSNFNLRYELAEYEPDSEEVNRFDTGVSLSYQYRRLLLSLGYRFRVDDSNIDSRNFTNNTVTLGASARF